MKIPLFLMVSSVFICVLAFGMKTMNFEVPVSIHGDVVEHVSDYELYRDYGVDPLPATVLDLKKVQIFPEKWHLDLISRLAIGATEWKMNNGGWWECGVYHGDREDVMDLALRYSWVIVEASFRVSEKYDFDLNPWGLAGTIANESGWDRCALGPGPRGVAYSLGLLEKSKMTISNTESDIIRAISDSRMEDSFSRTGYDLGTAQVLSRFYEDKRDYGKMVSLHGSTMMAAEVMFSRGSMYKSKRPWSYWPGRMSENYDAKVVKWARMLGASSDEI